MNLSLKRFLNDLPIKRKLLFVTLLTCFAALALACGALFHFQSVNFRQGFGEELEALGSVIAHNSAAPLAFEDKKSALEVLAALHVKPQIKSATLFDAQGREFAHFGQRSTPVLNSGLSDGHVVFQDGYAILRVPVQVDENRRASLLLRAWFEDRYSEMHRLYLGLLGLVLAGSLLIILLIATPLQRIITQPILALVEVAGNITEKQDYSSRAEEVGRDEVGLLTRAFNRMLDQIESREASLRESQQRFEVAVNGSSDGIWDWDLVSNKVFFSARWKSMLGYEEREVVDSFEAWNELMHPEDRSMAQETLKDYFEGRITNYQVEVRLKHKDGGYRWILSRGAALRDGAGKPVRMAGSHTDITKRKEAESELARLNRELLDTSRQAGMAEIATGVLHNVGNVLNSVNVSVGLTMDRLRKSKAGGLRKAMALIEDHRANLGEYLGTDPKGKQLLDYLKALSDWLETDQKELCKEVGAIEQNIDHIKQIVAMQQAYAKVSGVLEPINIRELVEDALRMGATGFARHHIEVVREYSETDLVMTDRHKILQILINLTSNAKQALEHRLDERKLTLRIHQPDGERVVVEVSDNGMGIAPENLARVFQHGFTTKKSGHGFGLHSGANAAKELGGKLYVQSTGIGKGATFVLELPTRREAGITPERQKNIKPAIDTGIKRAA